MRRACKRARLTLAVLAVAVNAMAGVLCYHFGADTLYPPDIHTVYVPIIESDSLRRDLGEQLSEAICKEIEKRTPFKVVGTPNADSVLTGRIKTDTKHLDAFASRTMKAARSRWGWSFKFHGPIAGAWWCAKERFPCRRNW